MTRSLTLRAAFVSILIFATFMIACAYSVLGDTAHAQEWMEKTAADGFPCFTLFEVEPSLEGWRASATISATRSQPATFPARSS